MNHSITGIAVRNDTIFIGLRPDSGTMGNRWEFPGGKVELGENFEKALIREYKEEFDCSITVGRPVDIQYFTHDSISFCLHAYEIHFLQEPKLIKTEHVDFKWATLTEIQKLSFVDSDTKLFPAIALYLSNKNEFNRHSAVLPVRECYPE